MPPAAIIIIRFSVQPRPSFKSHTTTPAETDFTLLRDVNFLHIIAGQVRLT